MFTFTIDIEPTNRCNAKCHFCPRDQTPHQGLMAPEVFEQSLARAVEFREAIRAVEDWQAVVSLCGLGEPLLNRHVPSFVRQVRDAGFDCFLSSNAALLDERRGRELLEAGVQKIFINAGEQDDGYDEVYKLPFGKTRDNILRFTEMAGDECEVRIVLVDHRRDKKHIRKMRTYWRELGITEFDTFEIMNRGGALFVDEMQFSAYAEAEEATATLAASPVAPLCGAPFGYLFIGWDGRYYLCCSDWRKEVPLASVFDTSFLAVTEQKLRHVQSREPICKSCNHDPVNRLTDELRAIGAGEVRPERRQVLVDDIATSSQFVWDLLGDLEPLIPADARPRLRRRSIPVVAG